MDEEFSDWFRSEVWAGWVALSARARRLSQVKMLRHSIRIIPGECRTEVSGRPVQTRAERRRLQAEGFRILSDNCRRKKCGT